MLPRYEWIRERVGKAGAVVGGQLGARVTAWAMAGPDLALLAGRVLGDGRVPFRMRGEIVAGALYVLSPVDIVPESLFGPIGLIDDATVLSRMLDTLLNRVPAQVVEEHWPGERAELDRLRDLAKTGRKLFSLGAATGLRTLLARGLRRFRHLLPGA
jgi:uncharacterized membrane protein YkvA (DUF1232 family)